MNFDAQRPAEAVARRSFHRKMVWLLAAALLIVHHDFWWWDNRTLVAGFLPITLAYHMAFSLAAGGLWVYAIFYAWPSELEHWADAAPAGQASSADAPSADAPSAAGGEPS